MKKLTETDISNLLEVLTVDALHQYLTDSGQGHLVQLSKELEDELQNQEG